MSIIWLKSVAAFGSESVPLAGWVGVTFTISIAPGWVSLILTCAKGSMVALSKTC